MKLSRWIALWSQVKKKNKKNTTEVNEIKVVINKLREEHELERASDITSRGNTFCAHLRSPEK